MFHIQRKRDERKKKKEKSLQKEEKLVDPLLDKEMLFGCILFEYTEDRKNIWSETPNLKEHFDRPNFKIIDYTVLQIIKRIQNYHFFFFV